VNSGTGAESGEMGIRDEVEVEEGGKGSRCWNKSDLRCVSNYRHASRLRSQCRVPQL